MRAAGPLFDEAPETDPAWRAPTKGEHVCRGCGAAACYGLGAAWLCPRCIPADFLPRNRGTA